MEAQPSRSGSHGPDAMTSPISQLIFSPVPFYLLKTGVVSVALAGLALTGCGSEGDHADGFDGAAADHGVTTRSGTCEAGTEAVCGVSTELANGTVSCFRGVQHCEGGKWGECADGTVTVQPDPKSSQFAEFFKNSPAALSLPARCIDNPCDPSCMFFDEDPEDIGGGGDDGDLPTIDTTGTECTHALCEVGGALDPLCNSCVAEVCDVDDTCCTTDWNQACVDLVYTECVDRSPPIGLCAFGLFSDTTVDLANRSSTESVIGAYGDITVSTDSVFTGIVATGNITYANLNGQDVDAPEGIYANGSITFAASSSEIRGLVQAGTYVDLKAGVKITDDVFAGEDIRGEAGAEIWGDAYANTGIAGVIDIDPGTPNPAAALSLPPVTLPPQDTGTSIPVLSVECGAAPGISGNGGSTAVSGPGIYGDVDIINNGELVLEGQGIYYFTDLDVHGDIVLDLNGETLDEGWEIRVCNGANIGNDGRILGRNGVPVDANGIAVDPGHLLMYVNGTTEVTLGVDVYWTGILMAPHASIRKENMNSAPTREDILLGTRSAPVNGALWGHSLTLGTDAGTYAISQDDCEALEIPGTLPSGECPIDNTGVPGPIVEPCQSGADCQFNYSCTEPETGAECSHSKCQPGGALENDCDPCVQKICMAEPSCCGSDWGEECVEMVATTCDAQCGPARCAHSACNLGAPLEDSCGTCVESVCDELPSCCTDNWGAACVSRMYALCGDAPPPSSSSGASLCDFAVFTEGPVSLVGTSGDPVSVTGGNVMSSDSNQAVLQYATVPSYVFAADTLDVDDSTLGSIYSGTSSASSVDNSVIDGTNVTSASVTEEFEMPEITRDSGTYACPAGDGTPAAGAVAPGDYGDVAIADGDLLELSAGDYTFASLTIGTTALATLQLPASGDVHITICGDLTLAPGAQLAGSAGLQVVHRLIEVQGDLVAGGASALVGFYNVEGSVLLGANSSLVGYAHSGGGVALSEGATVNADGLRGECIAERDESNARPSTPARLCAYGAYGINSLEGEDDNVLRGGDFGGGYVRFDDDNTVIGNVYSRTDVSFDDGGRAQGDLFAERDVLLGNYSHVGEAESSVAALELPSFPVVDFTCPTTGDDESVNTAITLSPDTPYGDVNLWNGAELTFDGPGKYYVDDLRLNQDNILRLPATGVVEVYACGEVEIDEETEVMGVGQDDAHRFRIYSASDSVSHANAAIWLKNGNIPHEFYGTLIAPNGSVRIGDHTEFYGLAWGTHVWVGEDATLDSTGYTGESCELLALDQEAMCPEEVLPIEPAESGSCVENEPGYTDATCGGYDLALGVACSEQVPVCNHGTDEISTTVEVGFWSEASLQMSYADPTVAPDGICTDTMTIPAGECQVLDCVVPSGLHTLMVDPESKLSECDGRRSDNWSIHDGRTCGGAGVPQTLNYEYEAECPLNSAASWGLLTWSTETPDTSTIEFRARVASSSGELAGAGFGVVGTAQSTPDDTQICGLVGVDGCPADITKELDLGDHQGSFLELEIEIQPDGSAPILEDWKVTYSCIVDQ